MKGFSHRKNSASVVTAIFCADDKLCDIVFWKRECFSLLYWVYVMMDMVIRMEKQTMADKTTERLIFIGCLGICMKPDSYSSLKI
ncbi:hypothetical protein HMSSN036_09070 [Paenibacillus macerans]|nr:hypothetical protein HMSSN036_09070 [Paenibacillus macerans]